jgi:hypothetical protein
MDNHARLGIASILSSKGAVGSSGGPSAVEQGGDSGLGFRIPPLCDA